MNNKFIKGTPGCETDSRINIINNNIFSKSKGDAFSNTELVNFIRENNINEIFIVGLDARFCVYRTSRGAVKRGFKTTILKDAVITSNMDKIPRIIDKYKSEGISLTTSDKFTEINLIT